jgi:hypothetical protein
METTLYASLFNYSPRRRTLRLADSSDGWFLNETTPLDCVGKKLVETAVLYNYSSPKWPVEYSEL